jgi:hypothetical protein
MKIERSILFVNPEKEAILEEERLILGRDAKGEAVFGLVFSKAVFKYCDANYNEMRSSQGQPFGTLC